MLAEVSELRDSRVGDGLGLFATRSWAAGPWRLCSRPRFDEGDTICELSFDNTTIMKPNKVPRCF